MIRSSVCAFRLFEITSPSDCSGNACFFGFSFLATTSPFDIANTRLTGSSLLVDNGTAIGFTHGLETSANGPIESELADRPWVMNLAITYCLADNEGGPADDDGPCEGRDNVLANGKLVYQVGIVMFPE